MEQSKLIIYLRKAKNGDEEAKTYLFNKNLPLIKSIINKFKNKGIEIDDLYQIASIGFLKAIKNFDESFNVKFSTYTVPMVIGEIKRYIRDNGAIKVSRNLKILANKINRYIDDYYSNNNDSPSINDIAKKFSVEPDDVVIAISSSKMPLSIYDKFEEDEEGQELIDKLHDGTDDNTLVDKIHLYNIINELNDREKKIIVLRYFRDKTQTEIAESLGVSQVQVSRLENKIINKLRLKY